MLVVKVVNSGERLTKMQTWKGTDCFQMQLLRKAAEVGTHGSNLGRKRSYRQNALRVIRWTKMGQSSGKQARRGTRPPGLKVADSPNRQIVLILKFGDELTNADGPVLKYQNRQGSLVWRQRRETPRKHLLKHRGHRNGWKGKSIKNKHSEADTESSVMEAFSKCSFSCTPALYSLQTLLQGLFC